MAISGRIRTIILSVLILIVGIIHLGVGIGIVAKYKKFSDTFQQQVSLSGYNVFVGLATIAVGILGLVSGIRQSTALTKVTAIASFVVGILALGSLIAALALSGNAAGYLHDSLSDNVNNYVQSQDSIDVVDLIQTTYQCCGVNLWFDWGRVSLGGSTIINNGRRRRQSSVLMDSPLTRAVRKKRQYVSTGGTLYNLPTSYSFPLPLSCCVNGGVSSGNSLGGSCAYNIANSSSSFYVDGCLVYISNIAFAQITGIAVINTCLTILAFVNFAILITIFLKDTKSHNAPQIPNAVDPYLQQQPQQLQPQQQQQQQSAYDPYYDPYYGNYDNSNAYYTSNYPVYKTYI